jgi:hypothetical protein
VGGGGGGARPRSAPFCMLMSLKKTDARTRGQNPLVTKYLRISLYIRKPFLIYDFATASVWTSLYMRKIWFSFYQCGVQPTHSPTTLVANCVSVHVYRGEGRQFFAGKIPPPGAVLRHGWVWQLDWSIQPFLCHNDFTRTRLIMYFLCHCCPELIIPWTNVFFTHALTRLILYLWREKKILAKSFIFSLE